MIDDFPKAEKMRIISEENQKVIELQANVDKYIRRANEKIEAASNDGGKEIVLFIREMSNKLNLAISRKVVEFLQCKGYSTKIQDTGEITVLNVYW